MAHSSRARTKFQTEYVKQSIKDEYPNHIKGATVYQSFDDQEGYYIFNKEQQCYILIHYLEDRKIWALIAYSDKE